MMLKGGEIYMNLRSPLYLWLPAKGGAIAPIDAMRSSVGKIRLRSVHENTNEPLSILVLHAPNTH
jgi:hypothetical protein